MKKSTLYLFFSLFLITGCLKTKKASFDVSSPAGFFFFGGIVSAIAAANSTASFSIPDPNLTFSNVQNTSVTVSWKSASAVSGTITYKAYFSLISDMDTVANMESNGSFTQDYAASVNQMTFSGLIPNKYYYFNVAAQNSGTKLNYTKKCIQVYQDSTVTDCSFDPLSVKGTAATVIGTCGTTGTTNGSFSAAQFKDPLYMQTVG
ncbi:MAG TPA: fibronectin type III domain-containing protein, partial [Leptospiraceae bacterium]|nr:fibronectin type III domain-containing protein [Leptospiraceae bacterium]